MRQAHHCGCRATFIPVSVSTHLTLYPHAWRRPPPPFPRLRPFFPPSSYLPRHIPGDSSVALRYRHPFGLLFFWPSRVALSRGPLTATAFGGQWRLVILKRPTHQAYNTSQNAPPISSGFDKTHVPHARDTNMSLTIFSRPFTISTYDPPSTPIALAAQDTGQTGTKRTVNEQGYRPGAGGEAPRTRTFTKGASEVWGRLKNTQATPPVKKKSELHVLSGTA